MSDNEFEPFKPPALGRTIARAFVTVGAAFKRDWKATFAPRWQRFTNALQRHYLKPVYFLAFLLIVPWAALVVQIAVILIEQLTTDIPGEPADKRAHFYSLGLTITGLGAALAAPFVLVKSWVNERQTRAAEEGLITDRITKAIQQLGAEKTVKVQVEKKVVKAARVFTEMVVEERTEPNLEVRLGAIYALERIAEDSQRDHIPIMETLCAYIRENSNQRVPEAFDEGDWVGLDDYSDEAEREAHVARRKERLGTFYFQSKAWKWAHTIKAPRADLQAALHVLGRRSEDRLKYENHKGFQLNLRAANLQASDLSKLSLGPALLNGARLEGASLSGAKMEGARMEGANLCRAEMEGARMEGADFSGANLKSADLAFWTCARTNARSADFTEAKNMTQDQVNTLFGDTDSKLPDGLQRTTELNHAPLEDSWDNDPEFERWKKAGYPEGEVLADGWGGPVAHHPSCPYTPALD